MGENLGAVRHSGLLGRRREIGQRGLIGAAVADCPFKPNVRAIMAAAILLSFNPLERRLTAFLPVVSIGLSFFQKHNVVVE